MTTKLATDKQIAFLRSLIEQIITAEQQVDPDNGAEAALATADNFEDTLPGLTTKGASEAIDRAKARLAYLRAKGACVAAKKDKAPLVPVGFYLYDDTVYRVVANQAGTSRYAKRLDPTVGRWAYAAGIVGRLTLADALTPEEAGRRGRHYGRCVFCGKELSVKDSTERGIGPDCWKKYCL